MLEFIKRYKVKFILILCIYIFLVQNVIAYGSENEQLNSEKVSKIDSFIEEKMKNYHIPGLAVVITDSDNLIYQKEFGYSDIELNKPITKDTYFGIGSYKEILTAISILELNNKNEIRLDDSIKKYIPLFDMKFRGKESDITVEQLLNGTSGISTYNGVTYLEPKNNEERNEIILTNKSRQLAAYPGDSFFYSPLNYYLLQEIIFQKSGKSVIDFMKNNTFKSNDLQDIFKTKEQVDNITKSYKVGFLGVKEYYNPQAFENELLIDSNGISKWLKKLMDISNNSVLNQSYSLDYKIRSNKDGLYVSNGWIISPNDNVVTGIGKSVGSSIFTAINPEKKIGVAILCNINSEYIDSIGQSIINILNDNEQVQFKDSNVNADRISIAIIVITTLFIIIILYFYLIVLKDIFKKNRLFSGVTKNNIKGTVFTVAIIIVTEISIYIAPNIFMDGISWSYIKIWMPASVILARNIIMLTIIVFALFYLTTYFFKKENDKPYFLIVIFSLIGGLGYAFVMFTVNTALAEKGARKYGLILYFIMGTIYYIFGQRLVRSMLTIITNNIVFDKRVDLISLLLKTPFYKFEKIGSDKIYTTINNDAEVISGSVGVIVLGITNSITMIATFIYLGISNFYAMIASVIFLSFGVFLLLAVNKSAHKYWDYSRDIQNKFFRYLNDIIGGIKELCMHKINRVEFQKDVVDSCQEYKEVRVQAELVSAYVYFVGELMAFFLLGGLMFVLPLIIKDMPVATLNEYILMFLFLKGPLDSVMNMIPRISMLKVSLNRIEEIKEEVFKNGYTTDLEEIDVKNCGNITIEIKNIEYKYKNKEEDVFSVGPLNYSFSSGEIVMITGGNGSGKSTFAKLLTGLYAPDSGEIYINDKKMNTDYIGEYFSTVFSDYYLFTKLYGIDYKNESEKIEKLLKLLRIEDKVQIKDGIFNTIKLSTGQMKRLALLISYVDDRPVYLFDEWAADQDPEFRAFFYQELLPELKINGKCVIAITHDDRYFNLADKIIKMEEGKIIE